MHRANGTVDEAEANSAEPGRTADRKRRYEFGDYMFNPETLELHGSARTVRLQPQPAKLLTLLIAARGAVVSRETVRRCLWPDEVHVEFDQSMNSCVKRIRVALGDSAESPEFIETIPRLGYRFLQPVRVVPSADENAPAPADQGDVPSRRPRWSKRAAAMPAAVALVLLGSTLVWRAKGPGPSAGDEPPLQVLTVLPFASVEPHTGAEPFRQGLAQELITSLGRHGSDRLAVVARDSRQFALPEGGAHDVRTDFVLGGKVQWEHGRLRVWARLLLARDGTVLWAESYDGEEDDLLGLEAELATQITRSVLDRLEQMAQASQTVKD